MIIIYSAHTFWCEIEDCKRQSAEKSEGNLCTVAGIERLRQDQINVKHIVGDLSEIDIGMAIVVRLNTRCYHAMLVDLMDWDPPKKATRKRNKAKKT